ncbi:MAG: translation elongation factor Ts [Candidatus Tectomicrobia bacterium]|uniref:Elongation factor Ts n=1 Tax=Tectimicrobiota bacterium TaxID=2528274 RepID=A0A932CQY0_UNCTE|nr:translation elongation factor Ts [Candidatus Tectomicrobia bacterium]
MAVTAAMVKELREKSGAGIMDCKEALRETEGDLEKAIDYLRRKGLASAARKSGRTTSEGLVGSYIHAGGRIGVLIEVNCETDFVARTEDFAQLVKDLTMQVAAANPRYISREEVSPEVLEREREIYAAQARDTGKPEKVIDRIVSGKLDKFYAEVCLLEQPFVKDPDVTVEAHIKQAIARLGENITVRRFTRYQVGEEL